MNRIDLGIAGEPIGADTPRWDELGLPPKWLNIVNTIAPGSCPHDIQAKAIRDCRLLHSRRNLVVSGPTNSGKSLLGYLAVLSGLAEGRRALLIEPFKALAQEKHDELIGLLPRLEKDFGSAPSVEITTGDYRVDGETMMTPPPKAGEIVIATPERVDAIMRNPDFDGWVSSFGVVCVDEAHLLADGRRGPSLECVMTRFLCEKAPPRFILLSATVGDCHAVQAWLEPCDIVHSNIRRPPLRQEIIKVGEDEKADDIVVAALDGILAEDGASVLVFVYRTGDTSRLAVQICDRLEPRFGQGLAAAYHSKMPAAIKAEVRAAYESGKTRCLVSTTALGAGVNLPATHVIVRDLTFGKEGPLPVRDLVQMMGRAGRGARTGISAAVLKPHDAWSEEDLIRQIRTPDIPDMRSALLTGAGGREGKRGDAQAAQAAKMVLGQLLRRERQSVDDIRAFFQRSFGGREIADQVDGAIRWLSSGERLLAFQDEGGVGATTLGHAVGRTGLSLEVGTGFGTLIRDLLSCDQADALLTAWKPLDTLLVLELVNPRERSIKRFSTDLAERIDDWVERSPNKPALFGEWIHGSAESSKAEQVLGSLGIKLDSKRKADEGARQYGYLATLRAIILSQLGDGLRTEDVGRRWEITGLDGVEERWRDHLLWQLAGIAEILDIRCFFYHLKQECTADDDRIARVKNCFRVMRRGVFELMGSLRFCSPLGPFFRDLEEANAGVGVRTKEKLEALGLANMVEIQKKSDKDLIRAGIQKRFIGKLRAYIARRML
jgi:helicase